MKSQFSFFSLFLLEFFSVLGIDLRASHMPGKHSTPELYSSLLI